MTDPTFVPASRRFPGLRLPTTRHTDLEEIPRSNPRIDVAVFHLGGPRVMGVLVTTDADQGGVVSLTTGPGAGAPPI